MATSKEMKIRQIKRKIRAAQTAIGKEDYAQAYRHLLTALYLLEEILVQTYS